MEYNNSDNSIVINDYIYFENVSSYLSIESVSEMFLKFLSASKSIRTISMLLDIEIVAVMQAPYGKHSKFFKQHNTHRFDTLVVASAMQKINNPSTRSSIESIHDGRLIVYVPIWLSERCIGYVLMGMFYTSKESANDNNVKSSIITPAQLEFTISEVCCQGREMLENSIKYTLQKNTKMDYDAKMLFNYGSFFDYDLVSDSFVLSRRTADIFGWDFSKTYQYLDFVNAIEESDRQRVTQIMKDKVFLGSSDFTFDTSIIHASDGRTVHIEIKGTLIKDSRGFNVRTLGSITDISILKETQAHLEDEIDNKNRLIRIIGHDLKNPFNGLLGFSELLCNSIETKNYDEVEEIARIIKESASQGYDLLVNLLDYSNSQSRNLTVDNSEFDLYNVIDNIRKLSAAQAFKKKITMHNAVPQGTILFNDEYKINTILRNLISNAIKFCYKDGVVLVEAAIENDGIIRVSVSDTGVDIPSDKLDKINRCREIDSTYGTANEKGTSIGLKLCYTFLHLLGSKLNVSCDDGLTTFYFDIRTDNRDVNLSLLD